jgi:hypothetical protein
MMDHPEFVRILPKVYQAAMKRVGDPWWDKEFSSGVEACVELFKRLLT